jgi:hypothetical protein
MRTPLIDSIFKEVEEELGRAKRKHPEMPSAHHAISVIREEYLELEKEIFTDGIDTTLGIQFRARREAIQLAVTCIRLIEFLT